jgi:hypothetical protein
MPPACPGRTRRYLQHRNKRFVTGKQIGQRVGIQDSVKRLHGFVQCATQQAAAFNAAGRRSWRKTLDQGTASRRFAHDLADADTLRLEFQLHPAALRSFAGVGTNSTGHVEKCA